MLGTRGQLQPGLQVLPLHHADLGASCRAGTLCVWQIRPWCCACWFGGGLQHVVDAALVLQKAPVGLSH